MLTLANVYIFFYNKKTERYNPIYFCMCKEISYTDSMKRGEIMGITVNVETCEKEYASYYKDTPVKTPTPRVVSFSL
jgi:hypothetical protein